MSSRRGLREGEPADPAAPAVIAHAHDDVLAYGVARAARGCRCGADSTSRSIPPFRDREPRPVLRAIGAEPIARTLSVQATHPHRTERMNVCRLGSPLP